MSFLMGAVVITCLIYAGVILWMFGNGGGPDQFA